MEEECMPVAQGPSLPFTKDEMIIVLASRLSPSSIAMYQRDVMAYKRFAEEYHFDPLSHLTLMEWRDNLVLHSTKSPNTINRMLSAVRRLMREAAKRERITQEQEAKFARVEGVTQKSLRERLKTNARTRLEPEDIRRLCDLPDTSTPIGIRDAALLATLCSSGIRVDEAVRLEWWQIKPLKQNYMLLVRGKTDTEYRKAYLSQEAYGLLMQWKEQQPILSSFVFTAFSGSKRVPLDKPVSKAGMWKIVIHYAKKCDLAYVKPHDLRRFLGTQLAAQDIRKAQKALGHKSIETTARHYVLDDLEPGLTDNLY